MNEVLIVLVVMAVLGILAWHEQQTRPGQGERDVTTRDTAPAASVSTDGRAPIRMVSAGHRHADRVVSAPVRRGALDPVGRSEAGLRAVRDGRSAQGAPTHALGRYQLDTRSGYGEGTTLVAFPVTPKDAA